MNTYANKKDENKSHTVTNSLTSKKSSKPTFQFVDNRPEAIVQMKLQETINNSPRMQQLKTLQDEANNIPRLKRNVQLQKTANDYATKQQHMIQKKAETIQLAKVTVRNNTDNYTSGWIQKETLPTGVETGPRNEAQKVATLVGGTWVGGHMVNDRLGGPGGFNNIVPITSSMNVKHKKIENKAQNALISVFGPKKVVKYNMNILKRDNFITTDGNEIDNLPIEFQQSYEERDISPSSTPLKTTGDKLSMFDGTYFT